MSITRTSAMATTGASEEDNLTAGMLNFNGGKNSATKSNQAVESTFKHSKEPVKELHLSSDEDVSFASYNNIFHLNSGTWCFLW